MASKKNVLELLWTRSELNTVSALSLKLHLIHSTLNNPGGLLERNNSSIILTLKVRRDYHTTAVEQAGCSEAFVNSVSSTS